MRIEIKKDQKNPNILMYKIHTLNLYDDNDNNKKLGSTKDLKGEEENLFMHLLDFELKYKKRNEKTEMQRIDGYKKSSNYKSYNMNKRNNAN